jgi:hypothetical protein
MACAICGEPNGTETGSLIILGFALKYLGRVQVLVSRECESQSIPLRCVQVLVSRECGSQSIPLRCVQVLVSRDVGASLFP